jgi:hypothetical protein
MLMTLYSSTKPILLKQSKNHLMEDYLSHQSISKELFKNGNRQSKIVMDMV